MAPKHALVRVPGERYTRCISSHPLRHTVQVTKARIQHDKYCEVLSDLGLEVIHIPRDDFHPDSCFVEDNAVVHNEKALICRMAKESRRGEEDGVESVLKDYMPTKRATAPATVEGGDVIHLSNYLISGVTQRTNLEGISQMKRWLGAQVKTIEDQDIVHLKSYVTYLGKGIMISTEKYASHPILNDFEVITTPKGDEYAADTLAIGDAVLMPAGYERAHKVVKEVGFEVIPVDVSEFEKCEGAITCLSILF